VTQILLGSLALSLLHAAIPSHWLPLVTLARAEHWTRERTALVTAAAGAAHTASTILIGILVGLVGTTLAATYGPLLRHVAPAILVLLGLAYGLSGLRRGHHHHHHAHIDPTATRTRTGALVASLMVAMFFSPCLEIEAYYLNAALYGWKAIAVVSIVYFVVTVAGMVALVEIGLRGARRLRFHFLDHHERLLTGGLLVLLGVLAWALEL